MQIEIFEKTREPVEELLLWTGKISPIENNRIPPYLNQKAKSNFRVFEEFLEIPDGWEVKTFLSAAATAIAYTRLRELKVKPLSLKKPKVNLILNEKDSDDHINFSVSIEGKEVTGKLYKFLDRQAGLPIEVSYKGHPGVDITHYYNLENRTMTSNGEEFIYNLKKLIAI